MRLRGCVIGLGTMGAHHLRILSQMADVDLVAVAEPYERRRAMIAARYPGLQILCSLDEVLDRNPLDFACIAAPVALLPELALQCVAANIPVLVEKPMAPTVETGRALVEAARKARVLLGVGYVERCNPAVRAVKDRLDQGVIGRVHQVHARRLSPYPGRDSSLGVALDLATHDVDVMRYLLDSEVTRVYAETARDVHSKAEDLLSATLRFEDETTGLLEVNWITPTKIRQLYITGTSGMLVVDYLMQDLTLFENPRAATEWDTLQGVRGVGEGDMLRYALARREPLAVQWEAFLAALRDEPSPLATGEDAIASLLVMRAVVEAGQSQEVVNLSWSPSARMLSSR